MTMSTASPSCCSTESVLPSNRQLHDHHPGCSAVTPPPLPLSPPRVLCSQTTKAMITTQGILSSNRQFYDGKLGLHPFDSFLAFLFFFKQKTAYEIGVRLVGSEMCIRDRSRAPWVVTMEVVGG